MQTTSPRKELNVKKYSFSHFHVRRQNCPRRGALPFPERGYTSVCRSDRKGRAIREHFHVFHGERRTCKTRAKRRVLELTADEAGASASAVSDEETGHGWLVFDASHRERSELGKKCTLVPNI
jgi:hypothetical protein